MLPADAGRTILISLVLRPDATAIGVVLAMRLAAQLTRAGCAQAVDTEALCLTSSTPFAKLARVDLQVLRAVLAASLASGIADLANIWVQRHQEEACHATSYLVDQK